MPHYKDGTKIELGDVARGKTHSAHARYPVQGVVTRLYEGTDTCNVDLAHAVHLGPSKGGEVPSEPQVLLSTTTANANELELVYRAPREEG